MKNLELDYFLELQRGMADIFRYVACCKENFDCFSIRMESLIVDTCAFLDSVCQCFIRQQHVKHTVGKPLAAADVSSQPCFAGEESVKKFAEKVSGKANFTMEDYRTLLEPELHLSKCSVRLLAYARNSSLLRNPDGYPLAPFQAWKDGKALPWWSAFTGLKHDRIENFKTATLGNAINALAAAFVVLSHKEKQAFHAGWVDRDIYTFFWPLYWENGGSIVPAIPKWRDCQKDNKEDIVA